MNEAVEWLERDFVVEEDNHDGLKFIRAHGAQVGEVGTWCLRPMFQVLGQ